MLDIIDNYIVYKKSIPKHTRIALFSRGFGGMLIMMLLLLWGGFMKKNVKNSRSAAGLRDNVFVFNNKFLVFRANDCET